MSETFEYAIRKDVRNNPIVREVDEARHRQLWKSVGIVGLFVVAAGFAGLQRMELQRHDRAVARLLQQLQAAEAEARHLKVQVEKLSALDRIEQEAVGTLGMVAPTAEEAVVLERVVSAPPPTGAVVARR